MTLRHLWLTACAALAGATWAVEPSPTQALAGVRGYGAYGDCIQEPGAQAGVYVYAGTDLPYEAPGAALALPDSLTPLHVEYVGRHGARFLTSRRTVASLTSYLKGCGPLTPVGKRVLALASAVDSVTAGRWGALVPQGRSELQGIGSRMAATYAALLPAGTTVAAQASYIPRCVESMDMLSYGLVWSHDSLEVRCASGTRFSPLLRPFDSNENYINYKDAGQWKRIVEAYADTVAPTAAVLRLSERGSRLVQLLCAEALARGVQDAGGSLELAVDSMLAGPWKPEWEEISGLRRKQAVTLAQDLYKLVSGCAAIGTGAGALPPEAPAAWQYYFTSREYYDLWSIVNLRHYLTYSASGLSRAPALMAAPLLERLSADLQAAASGRATAAVDIYLGHAETLMPLLALMRVPGAWYVTSEWGNVASHWLDWEIVPMGSNLQLVLCRAAGSGRLYLLTYLCEQPVGFPQPWEQALRQWQARIAGG